MSDIEIMEFPYGAFLKVRLEFVLLRDNELEAKIMRIIEGWMIDQKKAWMNECIQAASDGKPTPPEPDYFVTLSYAQIIAQLYMFNSSRKGEGKEVVEGKHNSITRRTVSKAMQTLIDDKVVFTRPNPKQTKEYDAAQYKLNCPLVQEQMRLLPRNPMSYLGSNGRIKGDPREIISHPPREKNSHPMRTDFTSPRENSAHGDVKNFPTLIDIENRDTNRMNERTPSQENNPHPSSHSSLSLSEKSERIAQLVKEARRLEEEIQQAASESVERLSTPDVDNTQSPIATVTTRNTSNERNTEPLLSEARRVFNLLCEAFFAIAPEFTSKIEKQCADLAPHVVSIEDLKSLKVYARAKIKDDPKIPDKQVYLGNLVKCVDGWKQEREPLPEKPKSQTSKPPIRNGAAAYDAMVAEVQARIAAKAGVNK